jgi:predicted RNA-binding protein YlqC (UPF0109 family)
VVFNLFKREKQSSGEEKTEPATNSIAELLKFIVVRLVDNPDDVDVSEVEGERNTILELKVNDEDMGKVIGKKGRIIKSLRIVLRAAAIHEGKSISIELVN